MEVDLVLLEQLENTRWVHDDQCFDHVSCSVDDMKAIVSFSIGIEKLSSHCHIFCTLLQYSSWWKLLEKKVKMVADGSTSHLDAKRTCREKKEEGLHMGSLSQLYTSAAVAYNQHPGALEPPTIMRQSSLFRSDADLEDFLAGSSQLQRFWGSSND